MGKWADPGGTAMPGQPVTRPEQAPEPHPLAKISLISKGTHGPGCGEYKFSIRTNIRIYLYPKNDTNEYPNIFVSKRLYKRISEYIRIKKAIQINIRIYLYQKMIRI